MRLGKIKIKPVNTTVNTTYAYGGDIGNNLYDDPKVFITERKVGISSKLGKYVNNVLVSEDTYNKAKSYNDFRDVADAGMIAMATNNALLSNKKAKKSLFQQQDNSIFGNI